MKKEIQLDKYVERIKESMGEIAKVLEKGGLIDEKIFEEYQERLNATLKELNSIIFAAKKDKILLNETAKIAELAKRENIVQPEDVIKICNSILKKLKTKKTA
ncbi:hypothetical protein DRJ22_01175 [Candidatus Woesearchaeota archaeon]|nr:MAG: hypothetical protein B6U93_02710 [Candidatus Woesearchaeota archaeon ex4484_78]RLE46756.1 MAG: hypothetical protein DRJ22_01175 [Candidatus Woesearchaeota archaeon]